MKHVLMIIKTLGRGGAERFLASSLQHGDRSRFRYSVAYLLRQEDALVAEIEAAGVMVRCLGGERGPAWMRRLREYVRSESVDLVHVHSPYAAIGARLALRRVDIPLVYHEYSLWGSHHPATRAANALTFGRNDYVLAVSDAVRRSIRPPWPLSFHRLPPVETIGSGIDLRAVQASAEPNGLRSSLGIDEGDPVVGTVANLRWQKGHAYLLQAAATVRQKFPKVRFVLVGRGPLEGDLRRQASDLGLDGSLVFAGARDDAPRVMKSFDVVALPSVQEGLPLVVLEAMAVGAPLVATRVGGIPEAVTHGRDGLLVPPRDPDALADAISSILGDASLRRALRAGGLERVQAFDIRRIVARMEAIYTDLLS
jgi:glycosyltransferase involved in cell wall biosynthesis